MTSPRHLWSGDWRRDSDAAAAELAKRRATEGGAAAEGETAEEPAPPPRLLRPRPPEPRPVDRSETETQPLRPTRTARPLVAETQPLRPHPRPPEPPEPPREPLSTRIAAPLRRARERLRAVGPHQRRLAVLLGIALVVVVGVAYGLAQIGGSGGSTPSSAIMTGRPWLGIEVSMPPGGGVIVSSVAPRGPAQRAGIAPGDVVLQVGNTPVSAPADVESALQGMHPGQSVPITVLRGADSYTTLATLAGAPAGANTP